MKNFALVLGWIAYAIVGLIQMFATVSGIERLVGVGPFFAWVISFFIGWTPLVGTALGIYGAHMVWQWDLLNAVLLFVGIPGFFLLASAAVISIAGAMATRRRRK